MCWHRGNVSKSFQWHRYGKEIMYVNMLTQTSLKFVGGDLILSKFGLLCLLDILVQMVLLVHLGLLGGLATAWQER